MRPYALIDLHCDTLTDCKYAAGNPDTLDDPKRVLSLSAIPTTSTGPNSLRSSSLMSSGVGRQSTISAKTTETSSVR